MVALLTNLPNLSKRLAVTRLPLVKSRKPTRPFHSNKPRAPLSMGKRKAPRQGGALSKKGNGQASLSRDDEPGPGQPTLTAYEQARNDNVASNQQLLANLRMPHIRGEESAQPRAARTPRCEPLRRGRQHPLVTQLCRRVQNGDLAPTRQSSRHRASALTPRDSAALNDDSGEPEVFLVPVGYWLRDTPHGATIHCSVENASIDQHCCSKSTTKIFTFLKHLFNKQLFFACVQSQVLYITILLLYVPMYRIKRMIL